LVGRMFFVIVAVMLEMRELVALKVRFERTAQHGFSFFVFLVSEAPLIKGSALCKVSR